MNILSVVECAYIAGIFDGEGTAQIQTHSRKNKSGWGYGITPRMQIPNTDKKLISWIHQRIPEFTLWTRSPRKKEHATSYVLVLTRPELIIEFINNIQPYLIIKKDHCLLVKNFCQLRINKRKINKIARYGEEELDMYKQLKLLNRKGESLFAE